MQMRVTVAEMPHTGYHCPLTSSKVYRRHRYQLDECKPGEQYKPYLPASDTSLGNWQSPKTSLYGGIRWHRRQVPKLSSFESVLFYQ